MTTESVTDTLRVLTADELEQVCGAGGKDPPPPDHNHDHDSMNDLTKWCWQCATSSGSGGTACCQHPPLRE